MKSLSKRAISLILAVLMIMDVFTPVAVVASTNSPQNNVHVLDEVPESETNSQNNEILIPATPQTNPKDDTLLPAEVPGQNSSQNSSQKPAQKPVQKPVQNNKTPNQLYKSWTLVNPGKTTYAKGDILDLSQLSVRVTKEDGTVTTLSYVQLLKDTNFDIIENVGNKINLQPGKGSVTLVGPNLNPITVNIVVNDSADKLQGTNSKDELVPAIDPQAKEENDELVVAENPNDKKTNIIEGNEQNSPEKDKQTEEKLEEEALKGNVFDQVLGKDTENPFGLKLFKNQNEADVLAGMDELSRMMAEFRAQFPTEQTQEEIDAGLIRIYNINPVDPAVQDKPMSPVFLRSAFRSAGLFEAASFNADQNQGLEMSGEEIPEPVGADSNGLNLDGKKFTVMTRFETSNALGPIKPGQFFKIHLDKELTVKDPSSLEPVRYNGQVIATPTYNSKDNIIEYKIVKEIPENIKVPLNIPVDYNPTNITEFNPDGTFTVTNKVSGLGVKAPKDLIPQKVDKNGNLAGSIIEPGRGDVPELIEADDKSYKVDMDAVGIPVVKDGKLEGFNWTAQVVSTVNLNGIDFHVNFTTVKGSGLGKIEKLAIGGVSIQNPESNKLSGKLGIVDSIHYKPDKKDGNKFTYTFYTPVTDIQETYMLDINAVANGKVGAKRIVGTQGYPRSKVEDATPNRVGMNNRTSILGEFANSNHAKWTVTDQVSTGDDGKLPLASRELGGNQSLKTAKVAVYGIDTATGKMVVKSTETSINPPAIPSAEKNPNTPQPVGTIAAYEYTTDLDQQNPSAYTLGGVAISKYEDLSIDQNWGLDTGLKMPAQDIKAVDPANENNVLGTEHVDAAKDDSSSRRITIPNVKVWNIDDNGTATRIQPTIKQDFPKDLNDHYTENYNYYKTDLNEYYIHNRAVKGEIKKSGNFKLKLVEEDGKTPIPGATFRLFRGAEVVTDGKGEAEFKNISTGIYYLTEVQAPVGYKLAEDTKIIIDENGKVKATGPDSTQIGDDSATQYFKDDKYPLFMNLRSFAIKGQNGQVTTYIYLKPDEGGGTNQNTRLNITGYNNDGLNVEVYDVDPSRRPGLNQAMDIQSGVENNIGGPALNQPNKYPIKGTNNVYDTYTGKSGYQIKIPHVRFGTNWGFLVKVTGTPKSNDGKISYDWLVDNTDPGNNSKIQKTITPADPNVVNEITVLVKNKKFETKPVEVIKVDSNKNPLGGATFVLRNSANNEVLKTVVSSNEADKKGKVDFGMMPQGYYTIEEIAGPEGYIESQLVFDVHVDEASQVTYTPRFKDGVGTPVPGVDYWIEDEIVKDTETKVPVVTVDQSMKLSENNFGETGIKPGVWEAYRYESYTYKANIKLKSSEPGKRFEIQFDPNLDFTQYVNKFPEIKSNGQVIAKPYFNYDTNLLTYVFTEASGSGEVIFDLVIDGVIPSKFYAKNSGDYSFKNIVAPGQEGVKGNQTDIVNVKAFYEDYDSHPSGNSPTQAYYFRDVYQGKDGNWYVKAIAYYNAKANLVGSRGNARTLSFNWMSTNWSPTNIAYWSGNGNMPAFELENVKVYSVQPTVDQFNHKTNEPYMPLSMGIRPENDPRTYRLELNQNIEGQYVYNRQGAIALTFDPSQIKSTGALPDSRPLKIDMPAISKNNEGYVIEQTFKVTDLNKFRNMFRAFIMQNSSDKDSLKSAFASKVNINEATAEQNRKEIPKFYKQKVMVANEEYVPTSFRIRKYNEADKSKTLEGAIFTLTNLKTNKTISKTTSIDGYLTFDKLQPGVYRLVESKAPKDFIKSDKMWLVNVAKDGVVTITEVGFNTDGTSIIGKDLILDVANKPKGQDFVVYKKGDQGQALPDAKFVIKKKDGENYTEVGTGISDTSGRVKFKNSTGADLKLTNGTYILEETEAPAGYKKLDKKWVLVVGNNKVEVHDYIEGPKEQTSEAANNSLLKEKGTHWVDIAKRSPAKFNGLTDPRWRDYVDNYPKPYKMGTRIVGINKTAKKPYVIQRFIINPEAKQMGPSKVQIHKQPLNENNMDWYVGTEAYKIFQLDKAVTENVGDIKLENYIAKEINLTAKKGEKQGEVPKRMEFDLPATDKPIIIDVKVPYKSESAGVGLGMDYWENVGTANEKVYWKPDFYESVEDIPVGDEVTSNTQAGNIVGAYISEGSLDVTNVKNKHRFEFTKVREKELDGLSGATFKLTGTNPVTETKWGKSDDKGKVSFEGLLPGTYKLEEHGAPQGYESSNTDWTVTIQDDGKIYIKDNSTSDKVPNTDPEAQWQKVDIANSTMINKSDSVREEYKQTADKKIKTHIVEINKATKRIRQVYVLNRLTEKLSDPTLELHSYPEKWDITTENTNVISVAEVGKDASPENLGKIGANVQYSTEIISKNNHTRLVINPKITGEKTIAVVIETDLKDQPEIGGIGTGMDYNNQGNQYWGAEEYTNINNFQLYPIANPTVDKNTKLIVGKATVVTPTPMARSAEEDGTSLSNTVALAANEDLSSITSLSKALRSRFFRSVDGLEIGDEIVGLAVRADGWEKVDPNRSRNKTTRSEGGDNQTKITKINKSEGKYRQIFLVNMSGEASKDAKFDFHAEPLNRSIYAKDYYGNKANIKVLSIRPVESTSTVDNIKYIGTETLKYGSEGMSDVTNKFGTFKRYEFKLTKSESRPFVIEVEYDYPKSGVIGLGMDYYKNFRPNKVWAAEKYASVDDINYKTSGPKTEVKEEEVRTTLPIPQEPERRPNANMKKGEEKQVFAGQEGYQIDIYKVTYIDDVKQPNPVFVRTKEKVDPQPRIIEYGTKDEAQPQPTEHTIQNYLGPNGVVAGVPNKAYKDQQITLSVHPNDGYIVDIIWLEDEAGNFLQELTDATGFTMPDMNVVIKATFEKSKFKITTSVNDPTLGSVLVDKDKASEGEEVTVTVTPKDDTVEITDVKVGNQSIGPQLQNGKYTFKMEAKDVHVSVTFNKKEVVPETIYDVGVDGNTNRKVVVYTRTAPNKAKAGELVEFTVTPNPDYEITNVWVQKSDGTGSLAGLTLDDSKTKGSFKMPSQNVTIYANVKYVQPPKGTYLVGINPDITGGSVTAEPRRPYPNDKVRIKATPNQGMTLDTLSVTKEWGGTVDVQYDNEGPYFIMPSENVTVYAKFKEGQSPDPGQPGGGSDVKPDDDELGYLIYDPSNPNKIIKKDAKLTNRKAGLELKIFKKDVVGRTLEGGEFKLIKTEADYKTPVKDFTTLTAVSGIDGRILFKDKDNQPVKLQKGYYVLEEIKPPLGYKKASSKWKIEVKDDQGRMHATYFGPSQTPSQYLLSKESKIQDDTTGTNLAIRTASKITHIDPDAKTFVQRVIIDLRGYSGKEKVNVQITPKYKRVEKDRPGVKPDTIKEGLKTAYRTTYKISNPKENLDTDYILGYYDLSKPGVSMVNTARWRPFDWGFDEDQLNLDPGQVYFIDIEGYYDESLVSGMAVNEKDVNGNPVAPHKNTKIKKEDLAKLEMDIKFYQGARSFYQAVYNEKDKKIEWNTFPKASYQAGAAALANTKPKGWSDEFYNDRYQNWVGLEGGEIRPALANATPIKTLSTSADISNLYTTDKPKDELDIPKEGLDIINDEETYNITFSKHGRDGEKSEGWESNGKKVTENRLEGAIFKLQQYIQNDYVDVPGSYVSSAFNGYFGFRGLKPGRYRLMEVEAPKGYRPIKGPILYMTVAYEEPKTNAETGDITPGRGKITLEYDNGNGIIEYNPAATNVEHGQLVDYVTSATAKNMGKIINEKPGQGKVRINKEDGEGNPLVGAKFRLIRLGTAADSDSPENKDGLYGAESENLKETATATVAKKDSVDPVVKNGKVLSLEPVRVGATKIFGETISNATVTVTFNGNNAVTVKTPNSGKFIVDVPRDLVLNENDTITASIDEKGVAIFDKLPIGNYILEEIKSPDGYKSNGQKWRFTVGGEGLDPYVNDTSSGGIDLTNEIKLLEDPEIRVQKTLDNDKTDTKNSVHPHKAQSIGITAKFTVPVTINPGDYFKVKLSDSIDLYGIYKDKPLGSLDIFADGVGTVAKAKYDKTTNTITYTFTEYARTYKLTELKTNLATWINLDKIKKSTNNVEVGIGLGDKVSKSKNYDVEYDIPSETSRHPYQYTEYYRYWYGTDYQTYNYWHNLTGKITEMDKTTGEFTQYYYINRMRDEGYPNWTFRYNPYSSDNSNTKKLNYANVRIMKLNNNSNTNIVNSMPESFALDVNNDANLTEILNQRFDRMGATNFNFSKDKNSGSSSTDSYIVEVKGKIPLSEIKDFHSVGSIIVRGSTIAARWDLARFADNKAVASAQLIIQAINPKNEIKFRKTDYKGTSLAGAIFALYKKNGESWQEVKDSEQTTKADGLVSYEKLAPGDYALFEKKAPEGYNKIEGHIEEFSVGQNGEITRYVDKNKPVGQAVSSNTGSKDEKVSEPVGSEPIDVINYKNIEFIKIDSIDRSSLEGAEFKVLYKKGEKDKYKPIKVSEKSSNGEIIEKDMTVTSGEDGKFKLEKIYEDGYYALEEIKAPKGYSKMPGYIREFLLEKGKVLVKEKDPIQSSLSRGANGKITSQVLSVDKDNKKFTQRIIINPKHEKLSIPEANSFLRIIENGWEIPKEAGKIGGKVKVAILKKDNVEGFKTKIEDLTSKDYTDYYAETYGKVGENFGSRYSLRKFLGIETETGDISTTDTIVVEYTGELKLESIKKDSATNKETLLPVEQKADVILGLEVIDEVNYTLDIDKLATKGPVYVDTDKYNLRPIEVENRKAEYPHTGGMGTFIFTSIGMSLIGLAYLSYRRRRGLVFDE
ncbi:SpaA isopeptide-forming pilin-related protein [Peptoniphilus sp. BV3AC2]|uniref:SpaA isopeptide-forming pilin-related protein n=1 Tax=Peptoniphilus sp. BV3AC2 TaxID=1111133 RepID=UPI0003B8BBEB|nr:SpaA isopeptide-forming pilin-related protein [Peptoniphilus sp. BV3AC2]ERT62986.1 LPXTG cell wall anchor domain protein [Peptoniphilus sp. BV3AC2]